MNGSNQSNPGIVGFSPSNQSAFGTLETGELTFVLQGDFVFGLNTQTWNYSTVFTITSPSVAPTNGAIYSNSNNNFLVFYTSGTTMSCQGFGSPAASGTLTKISGTGDATITYSSFTMNAGTTNGTGALVDTNGARLRIQSGTTGTGYSFITSRKIIRYRAGQGTLVRLTPVFTTGVANNIQLWGVGVVINNAPYDGYFFGYNGIAFGIFYYNTGVQTFVAQTIWNGDRVDATSPSFNWDPTKGTPVMIKYPYLGFGDIFFYVQNPFNGSWILVHTIKYANTVNTPQLSNPSLQLMGYTLNSGNTTNMILYCASMGAAISGIRTFITNPKWATDINRSSITNVVSQVLTLRNCLSYNGVTNRAQIRLNSISLANLTENQIVTIRLILNPIVGGTPSFTPVSGSTSDNGLTITSGNSMASYDSAATTILGGLYIFNFSVGPGGTIIIDLTPYEITILPGDNLVLAAIGSGAVTANLSLNWTED